MVVCPQKLYKSPKAAAALVRQHELGQVHSVIFDEAHNVGEGQSVDLTFCVLLAVCLSMRSAFPIQFLSASVALDKTRARRCSDGGKGHNS